ncbi:CpsD/CapB family tyrosine-protein kinase [Clostridium sp. YIM B02555]|uniref:CpsD/CapB family tyrosine-protein kinase n=1 Tax=Clostridium sp. YIM B02555 TaxID=2911968 RepID=UPI001EEED1A0|nr:CpsD/CapB family tyrosine-protein kinase [Clostridium sp. YIM B02555]
MFKVRKSGKAVLGQEHKEFIVEQKPKSLESEAYKTLRTDIQYSSFNKQLKAMLITSSEKEEGKSTVSGNLALSFAQNDKKIILVDCDLRRPSIHKKFKISNLVGLSEILIGKTSLEETVQQYNDNLDILSSGKIPPNPSEMLSSNAMNNLIEKLKEKYDIVILDSAPLQAVTDAQILATKVDGTILVVRAERTKKESIIEAKSLLDKVGANIIGTVLNAAENTREKYHYY